MAKLSKPKRKFWIVTAGFGAILALTAHNISWNYHKWFPGKIIVEQTARTAKFFKRHDFIYSSTFLLFHSGTTITLPADWNTANNTIHAIGAGAGGGTGGSGGGGGGGGAWSSITNASCAASTVQNISTFTGDMWMRIDGGSGAPASVAQGVLAKAGAVGVCVTGGAGGLASGCIGNAKNNGGTGGSSAACLTCGSGGGGGGGAGGPNAAGKNGLSIPGRCLGNTAAGGQGDGTFGGAGGTISGCPPTPLNGQPGTEWPTSPTASGSGGGGLGSATATNGGLYGGGGGGGISVIGTGAQGVIVLQYVPASAGPSPATNYPVLAEVMLD